MKTLTQFDMQLAVLHFQLRQNALKLRQLPEVQELRKLSKDYKLACDWIKLCDSNSPHHFEDYAE
jgi:hypothetical protein